jgi:hypothetical protein
LTHQNYFYAEFSRRQKRALYDGPRGAVPTHRINGDFRHKKKGFSLVQFG